MKKLKQQELNSKNVIGVQVGTHGLGVMVSGR